MTELMQIVQHSTAEVISILKIVKALGEPEVPHEPYRLWDMFVFFNYTYIII